MNLLYGYVLILQGSCAPTRLLDFIFDEDRKARRPMSDGADNRAESTPGSTAATSDTFRFALDVLPLMTVVLSGFLIIGIVLPVLPRHVHDDLEFNAFAVGCVTAAQFVASLASRLYAGRYADMHGGRRAIALGLVVTFIGGVFYLASLPMHDHHDLALGLILLGRAIVGSAESLIITGGMTLGLALAGSKNTGRVIAWVGTAMFAAFALGSPVGLWIYDRFGFFWVVIVSMLLPIAALLVARVLPEGAKVSPPSGSFATTLSIVWLPGLGAAFNGVGFAALLSFSVLLFSEHGWNAYGWLPVTSFAVALIAARLFLGQLIDGLGSTRVGVSFTIVNAAGQALMWWAPSPWISAIASALTGVGWAMVYPAFGAEAVSRMSSNQRGLAMAAYSSFPDFAIGVASPLLGLLGSGGHLGPVYLWSATAVVVGIPIGLISSRGHSRCHP